ncbi:MAG: class I SAM-dependent methyltransferase [Candidatus Riflebacteria bacterium]|nr:class I SAM-dependent methyltransferase [Candidatus Riflebacteria bacterium]
MNFDQKARDWDLNPMTIERTNAVAQAIRAKVPLAPGDSAFEYGCGTGSLSFHLQPFLGRICLADSSDGMLEVLKEKISKGAIKNMTPMKLDLMSEPHPEIKFDLIYMLMALHHVEDTEKILSLFHGMMKRSGYLCIADLDKEDGSFHEDEFHGHLGFDREELKEKLTRQKFENIQFSTVYEMKKEISGKKKVFPIFLMIAQKT